ncbi:hypothetical protein [Kitasatospora herbaricolor]|uniref:hypothetical protein n=1 Tax=Kitasatospora herbaricolor TaxID=68217 RepID=UPI0036DB202A
MSLEAALLESRTLRDGLSERVDALDKVKILVLLPDGVHATTRMVADYYEVPLEAVKSHVKDHREELERGGYRVLAGQELREFKALSGIDPRTPWLGVFPRRAVLNVAMLLRDSPVARQVRSYLLDAEETTRPATRPRPGRSRRSSGRRRAAACRTCTGTSTSRSATTRPGRPGGAGSTGWSRSSRSGGVSPRPAGARARRSG